MPESKISGRLLRGILIALLATAAGFAVESTRLAGTQSAEGVIVALRPLLRACANCDNYEMVIEYSTPEGTRRFNKSRAVWDVWGEMGRTGTRLPVLYHADGRAWVDRFFYTYPFTGALLVFDGLLGIAWLWLATLGRKRFLALEKRHSNYRHAVKNGSRNLGRRRRLLLSQVHRMLLVMGAGIIASVVGFTIGSIGLALAGLLLILAARLYFGSRLHCAYCNRSLIGDLREMQPHVGGTINWLMVRDALAKGVPLPCSHCGRELD